MLSFLQLWEHMAQNSSSESLSMRAIRNGLVMGKNETDFWDNFITVANDSAALSELLDIPKEKISSWASKVREVRNKVSLADDQEANQKGKKQLIPTGQGIPDPQKESAEDFSDLHV